MGDSGDLNSSKTEVATNVEEDEELAALLDSAVKDFQAADDKKEVPSEVPAVVKPTPPDSLFTDDYLRSTAARFEQNMSSLFSPGPDGTFSLDQLGENLSRLADASTQAAGFETSPDGEFSSIIAQTLKNLSENTDNLQSNFSDDDLMNMLGSLGNLPDGNSDPGDLVPFMQKMMQNLLSKEILHPALANLVEKYPAWLEENKSKVSEEEYGKYNKQFTIMKSVCTELEKETPEDSDIVKRTRFDKVLALMQEMQDCGQPPKDLVGELGPLVDELGRPQIPGGMSPDQCCLQ